MFCHRRSSLAALLVFGLLVIAASDVFAAGKSPGLKRRQWQNAQLIMLTALPAAVIIAVGGLALQTAYRATFIKRGDLIAKAASRAPVKCFVLGSANSTVLFVLAASAGDAAPPVSLVLVILLAALASAGLTAKSENLGTRVALVAGYECNPVIALVIGWPTIVCLLLIPFVGWAVVLYLAVTGVGAAVLSFFGSGSPKEEAEEVQPVPDVAETDGTVAP